jgi:hypothetical protein
MASIAIGDGGFATPIATSDIDIQSLLPILTNHVINLESSSQESIAELREYPTADPRYIHPLRETPKRSFETPHSVCNQSRKKRRSNLVVKINSSERLRVPNSAKVVDLSGGDHDRN